jgi:hypothetical protein
MYIQSRFKWMAGLIIFYFLLQAGFAATATTPVPTPVGRVVWVKGTEFKAVMPNKEQRILQKLSIIYLHDQLITDDKTQAEIVFTDNTLMTFREKSQYSIDQYSYKPKQKSGSVGKYIMSITAGGFRTITGLIAKNNPNDYQVNSPVATIGVRGTDYQTYYKGTQMYLGYYKGTPCIQNKGVPGVVDKSKQNIKQICLDAKTPYAYVPNGQTPPVPLTKKPDVFNTDLTITPATVAPFSSGGTTSSGGGVGGGGGGNSFCITN